MVSGPVMAGSPAPIGPVFLSYRHSDGADTVERAARVLRAHGVPIWLDQTDLPPGDIGRNIQDALDSGLSGGVLVATPGVALSPTIKDQEVPALLALAANLSFKFAVLNTHKQPDGSLDIAAPRISLGLSEEQWGNPRQYPTDDSSLRGFAGDMARVRVGQVRAGGGGRACVLEVQTRRSSHAKTVDGHLVFRSCCPPDGSRILPDVVWEDLQAFTARLPQLVEESGCAEVEIRGGSHLSVAFAIGAALPETSGFGLRVADRTGIWTRQLPTPAESYDLGSEHRGRPAAILVDINPTDPPEDTFAAYLAASAPELCPHEIVRRVALDASTGEALAASISGCIRQTATAHNRSDVHLFLRTPWPVAILLGASLNTLSCYLYEWSNAATPAAYVPSIMARPGVGGGPIREITQKGV